MASNKYSFLLGLLMVVAFSATAQVKGSYDWRDSTLIPSSRTQQHQEFLNNQYPFPAKPRNQWEIGIKAGAVSVLGDVPAKFPRLGFGAHVRKSFGYIFSARLEYMHGSPAGQHWSSASNYMKNPAWRDNGYVGNTVTAAGDRIPREDLVYYNYKANLNDLSLQALFSLNNVRFHKSKTGVNFYAIAGLGLMWYETKVNALDGNNQKYNFNSISGGDYPDRGDTKDAIKDLLDDSYETPAESYGNTRMKVFGMTGRPNVTAGFGVAFKLSNRFNLAFESRQVFSQDDLIDGQRWEEQPHGDAALTTNHDTWNYTTLGLNFNLGGKSVEPLYWLNPMDYAYNELNSPKHMLLPKPILDDADGDGVTDQFDMEPNTPAGCPVDSHGVSKDTDGDGVPDCKDKELITPTAWQPVDADGVGKAPCPDSSCYEGLLMRKSECAIGDLPSVAFSGKSVTLSKDAEGVLASVADRLRQNPTCKMVVTGYACEPSKAAQQMSWDRVNKVINYMVEKQGISSDRFIFKYGESGGDCNTVDLRAAAAGDEGPNTVPAPHPNLRKS